MKKLLLALALIAGALVAPHPAIVTPGFAQAPPPVPAEPDAERRTRYSGVSNVTTFPVGFDIYGDGTDYTSWLEVWVNGVKAAGWSLVPTSGSFTTLSRPLLAANLNVVFTQAQSGTIDIVGARRPRRTSQLSENRGVTARDFNQLVTDLWMTERERWDRAGRILMAPPGETLNVLAAAATRAGQFLCWDQSGQPTSCVATAGTTTFSAGTGIVLSGTNPTVISSMLAANGQSGNYTLQASDCQKTVVVSGGQYTITLPTVAAGSFPTGCEIAVKNGDGWPGGRGKKMSGWPSDINAILWPGQVVRVKVVNSAWTTTHKPGRWILPATAELCVVQNGSDTNDGLGSGAAADCLAKLQTAVNTIGTQWDGGGYSACNIGLYAGGTNTFNEAVNQTGQSVGCYLSFYFRGAVTWTSNTACFSGGDNGITIFYTNVGFTPIFQCNLNNAASSGAFYCHQTCIFDWFGGFEWIPGGNNDHLFFADAQGRATMSLPTSGSGLVIGDANIRAFDSIFQCDEHCSGFQVSGNIGFSPNVTGNRAFVAYGGSWINTSAAWTGTATGITTSIVSGNSVLITNGTTIPGGTVTSSGGQVCTTKC